MIHIVVGIIAIHIEGMATDAGRVARHVKGTIDQGTASNQLRLDQFTPLFVGIINLIGLEINLLDDVGITITKDAESLHNLFTLCSTAAQTIVHRLGLTHIAHEPGDGINIRLRNLVDTT